MNHRPFEDWLLDDERLTPEQNRNLQSHLRECRSCSALAEVNLALRSARGAAPAPGFAARFQSRLAAQRAIQRRRMLVGASILTVGGLAILAVLIGPFLSAAIQNPAEVLVSWASVLTTFVVWGKAVSEAMSVISRIVPNFIPAYAWLIVFSAISGLGLLWGVSFWRFTRIPTRA